MVMSSYYFIIVAGYLMTISYAPLFMNMPWQQVMQCFDINTHKKITQQRRSMVDGNYCSLVGQIISPGFCNLLHNPQPHTSVQYNPTMAKNRQLRKST